MSQQLAHSEPVRLDKWLWAARFFKTRAMATEAINGGKVHLNGARVKPSRAVAIGATISITQQALVKTVVVKALSERRGPAKIAETLYEETEDSIKKRDEFKLANKYAMQPLYSDGKPSKKDRRSIMKFKKGGY